MESINYFFEVGGWAMYGIVICSVVAFAVFLERLWFLRPSHIVPRHLAIDVEAQLQQGKLDEAVTLCRKGSSVLAKILEVALPQTRFGIETVAQWLQEETDRQAYALERGIGVLSMIMTLAPLLGFLGTVLGMVDLFSSIAAEGEIQNIGVIAGGVYKALYTTIAGLTVAIPATLFHKYALSLVDRRLIVIEETSARLLSLLKGSA